jgi:hypothetical protein
MGQPGLSSGLLEISWSLIDHVYNNDSSPNNILVQKTIHSGMGNEERGQDLDSQYIPDGFLIREMSLLTVNAVVILEYDTLRCEGEAVGLGVQDSRINPQWISPSCRLVKIRLYHLI